MVDKRLSGDWRAVFLWLSLASALVLGGLENGFAASDTDARIAFYRARIGGPATYPAYARLGLAYFQKARETGRTSYYDEALQHLLKSLSFQRNFEALLGAALIYSERHEFRKALTYADEAVSAFPNDLDAQGILFDIYLALGDMAKADAISSSMVKLQPGFAAYNRLAALRYSRGDLAGALEAMIKARDDAVAKPLPATTRAWAEVRVGSMYLARCDPDLAKQAYYRALRLVPDYFFALEHLAELDAAQGSLTKAVETYRKLLRRVPDARHRLALVELCAELGKSNQARQEQEKAMSELRRLVAGGSQAELRPLALVLLDRPKDVVEGLELAKRDWQNRQDVLAADTLAWAWFKNGNYSEARKMSAAALLSGTLEPLVLLHASLIQMQLGNRAEARTLLEQVTKCNLTLGLADRHRADTAWQGLQK